MSKYIFKLCIVGDIGIEIWKEIPYTNHYEISTLGRVRQYGVIKKPFINENGYCIVNMSINGKVKHLRVHRLVGEAFLPKWRPDFSQINHKDENKMSNECWNLEWCNCSYNVNYGNGKTIRKNTGQPMKVNQYTLEGEFVKTHNSIAEAYKSVGSVYKQMKSHLEGKHGCKSVKGFVWRYAD